MIFFLTSCVVVVHLFKNGEKLKCVVVCIHIFSFKFLGLKFLFQSPTPTLDKHLYKL